MVRTVRCMREQRTVGSNVSQVYPAQQMDRLEAIPAKRWAFWGLQSAFPLNTLRSLCNFSWTSNWSNVKGDETWPASILNGRVARMVKCFQRNLWDIFLFPSWHVSDATKPNAFTRAKSSNPWFLQRKPSKKVWCDQSVVAIIATCFWEQSFTRLMRSFVMSFLQFVFCALGLSGSVYAYTRAIWMRVYGFMAV